MKSMAPDLSADTLERITVPNGKVMVEIRSHGELKTSLVMPSRSKQKNRSTERTGHLYRVGEGLGNVLRAGEKVWFLIVGGKEIHSGDRQFWLLPEDNILCHDPDDVYEVP